MPRTLTRMVLASALAAVVVAGPAHPAEASCVGPKVSVTPTALGPGDSFTVTGEYFGTDCYDTGTPSGHEGEGGLGPPATDIEVIVQQGDRRIVVARGDADAKYRFEVEVSLPPDLRQGDVSIAATLTDSVESRDVAAQGPVALLGSTPAGDAVEVAAFGPIAPSAAPAGEHKDDRDHNTPYVLGAAAALAVAAAVALGVWRLRRAR